VGSGVQAQVLTPRTSARHALRKGRHPVRATARRCTEKGPSRQCSPFCVHPIPEAAALGLSWLEPASSERPTNMNPEPATLTMRSNAVNTLVGTVVAAAAMLATGSAHAGKTLDAIKARGQVVCGVNTGLAGFSQADSNGSWSGLDVDVCRAIAASILGDGSKVKFVPLNAQQRFTAL
jgi:hypothetical protein